MMPSLFDPGFEPTDEELASMLGHDSKSRNSEEIAGMRMLHKLEGGGGVYEDGDCLIAVYAGGDRLIVPLCCRDGSIDQEPLDAH